MGLGSDYDGISKAPEWGGCDGISETGQKDSEGMAFLPSQIEKVFYKNVMRVFQELYDYLVPKRRSPASPRPGVM